MANQNKKRTLITVTSVFFAIFLALLMRSMQLASYDMMITNSVKSSTGYLQIQADGYWDDKSINNTFESGDELIATVTSNPGITLAVPRLESFALASFGNQTKGTALIGVDAEIEDAQTGLSKKLVKGSFINHTDHNILVAEGLAEYLKADVGDSIVLLGQGYQGATAAGLFRIGGIIRFPTPDLNNQLIYMPLHTSQEFFSAQGRLTSISLMLQVPDEMDRAQNELASVLPEGLVIMTWKEMLKEMLQGIQSDNVSGLVMLAILYLVVGFGILGTVIMMTIERKKEFGIMIAVGMQKKKLMGILAIETILITLLGIISGALTSIPILFYMKNHPIPLRGEAAEAMLEMNWSPVIPFIVEPGFFINQSIAVLLISLIIIVYPLKAINKLKIVNAIKGR